jgi:uncharacterized protein (TIGR01620 family)
LPSARWRWWIWRLSPGVIYLINRIATLYGIELGYYSRLRLFRLVLLNIAFAGASELVREVGMDWMSQDLAARLSARAAQGLAPAADGAAGY